MKRFVARGRKETIARERERRRKLDRRNKVSSLLEHEKQVVGWILVSNIIGDKVREQDMKEREMTDKRGGGRRKIQWTDAI